MKNDDLDLESIADLVDTKFVCLTEIIKGLSEANSFEEDKIKRVLSGFGFATLRPLVVHYPPDAEVIEDESNKDLVAALTYRLKGMPQSALSEEAENYAFNLDIEWEKQTLVNWCQQRKLQIPQEWNDWMNSKGVVLIEHGLIDDRSKPETTTNKRDAPQIGKREVRKHQTHELHNTWCKEARKLRKEHSSKSKAWIAEQVRKKTGSKHAVETIRKVISPEITGG